VLFIGTEVNDNFGINLCILLNFISPDYCKRVLADEFHRKSVESLNTRKQLCVLL
jgi:hypothetical protein